MGVCARPERATTPAFPGSRAPLVGGEDLADFAGHFEDLFAVAFRVAAAGAAVGGGFDVIHDRSVHPVHGEVVLGDRLGFADDVVADEDAAEAVAPVRRRAVNQGIR